MANALRGMKGLRADVNDWQNRQVSDDAATRSN
jgi:hypothetical protein